MSTIGIGLNLLLLGGFLIAVAYVTHSYLTAPSSMAVPGDPPGSRPATIMDKLAYSTKKSATLFVNLATGAFLSISTVIFNMADFIGAPEVRTFVTEHSSPQIGAIVILVIIFLTTWARIRTLTR